MTTSLVVTTWFPDSRHPARTPFCLAHVRALQTAGIDVAVVHVDLDAHSSAVEEVYEGIPIRRIPLRPRHPRSWFVAARAIHRSLARADVLHTMAFSSVLVAALPWACRRRPWVHTEHWNGVISPRSVGGWWQRLSFLRHLLRLPHAVTGVTEQLAEAMSAFARPGRVAVVPCVVEAADPVEPFPPMEPLRLVGVGLLNERKNPLLAVDTVAWLVSQGVDVYYDWIGDGPLRVSAQTRAVQLGVAKRITFVGSVPPPEVPARISSAHIFFVPSSQENFFTAAAEAIVAGRMVVLPRAGGFVEYCTTDNSVLVEDWSPESLGRAIIVGRDRLRLRDPESIALTIGGRFSHAEVGSGFDAVYQTVMRGPDAS